jgi:hypothetical protein
MGDSSKGYKFLNLFRNIFSAPLIKPKVLDAAQYFIDCFLDSLGTNRNVIDIHNNYLNVDISLLNNAQSLWSEFQNLENIYNENDYNGISFTEFSDNLAR